MKNKSKTLVILSPGFPSNEEDSTCIPSRQLFVKAVKKNDPSLHIIVLAFQYPFMRGEYRWNGIQVIGFGGKGRGKLYRVVVWLRAWKALKKIQKENEVIGILSFWLGECAFVGKHFAAQHGLKQYTWLLGQDAKQNNRYFYLTKPTAGSLIALSDFITDHFFKNYAIRPGHLVPVGIDPSLFKEPLTERDIDILGAGSLIPLKQYGLFIEVIKSLVFFFPGIRAVICGRGPEKQKLLDTIEQEGLEDNIILMDEIPHTEALALMQRAKVFLHTSLYEGFGTVCAEALYAGAQVVSFCKPMHQVAAHHHIVETITEMKEKTRELLEDPNRDHSRVLLYSADQVAHTLMQLFDHKEFTTS